MVPSLEAVTPDPAVAFVTPFGKTSSGQILRQLAAHEVLLAFKV